MKEVISTTEQKMNMFISEKGYDAKFVDLLYEIKEAYLNRISLSSSGFYSTPKIYFNKKTFSGRIFSTSS